MHQVGWPNNNQHQWPNHRNKKEENQPSKSQKANWNTNSILKRALEKSNKILGPDNLIWFALTTGKSNILALACPVNITRTLQF